ASATTVNPRAAITIQSRRSEFTAILYVITSSAACERENGNKECNLGKKLGACRELAAGRSGIARQERRYKRHGAGGRRDSGNRRAEAEKRKHGGNADREAGNAEPLQGRGAGAGIG